MSTQPIRIQLQNPSVAPVLSYNVPEPTSYSGRNFIDLALPDNYFRTDISFPPNVPGPQAALDRLRVLQASVAKGALAMSSATTSSLLLPDGERISAALARLDPAEVEAMQREGKELVIYRSLSGMLTHKFIDRVDYSGAAAKPQPLGVGSPAVGATANCFITAPANNASLSGPYTGVPVTITGRATTSSLGASVGVEVSVGGGGWQYLQTGAQAVNWTYDTVIRTAGQVVISARASDTNGSTFTTQITVNVTLAPAPDTTAPTVVITSPAAGGTIIGSSAGATVPVQLTATDAGSGVSTVQVAVDSGTWQSAARDAATGAWNVSVSVPTGEHTIRARCTDNAGNVGTAQVAVTVAVPDTTPPTVAITSPAAGAQIAGPMEGVNVQVTGTASDASGVQGVTVSLNDGSDPVAATPRAPGDWSQWSATVRIQTGGPRVITAHCTDARGNGRDATIAVEAILVPDVVSRLNRIILVESCRLSSYLGTYGVGRTLKTFSLLPGEKTKLSVKTYTKTETEAKQASSVLDSYSDESSVDFENSMAKEQSNKTSYDETSKYSVDGEAKASWGWGSASIKAGVSGGTNSAREEFAKNVSNAAQKHVAKASTKRDVQINTSYEVKSTTGEETEVVREIENVNVSRTLNFVFRQMNQEFITMLHLVDVRLAFFKVLEVNGETRYVYREFTLPEIDALLNEVVVPEHRDEVRNNIVRQLQNVFDYREVRHEFVEWHQAASDSSGAYLRVKRDYTSHYHDNATGTDIVVPGIILAANRYVLRTEGVVVEALLGQGDALDEYSRGLQDEAVMAKQLANSAARQQHRMNTLAMQIVAAKDEEAARLFAMLFPKFAPAPADADATPAALTGG
ncbi:MAG: hypothetical protein JO040_00195 [Gemmatimonadetes bacterium]|nr:hypothetical protein [Gemmatimonadota bacterium]